MIVSYLDFCCSLIFSTDFGLVVFLKKTVLKDEVFPLCVLYFVCRRYFLVCRRVAVLVIEVFSVLADATDML